ncbi:hypothetical protein E5676_scaffold409G00040 [Cucumis melo var. makuwa]|uniref:Uncharacterized protein n=1 Tax=Cucumis melo var. makuwa TaxID=1194695 RepID=A0A5A7SN95_CUCMM|nr:hypothetical protein E6C27_scaffold139G004880 [Cucumis melo var. makuwa]TYK04409.1 hypothetical protein E5676_scaffold409G00040 [Cucumis melo var. makuwa]
MLDIFTSSSRFRDGLGEGVTVWYQSIDPKKNYDIERMKALSAIPFNWTVDPTEAEAWLTLIEKWYTQYNNVYKLYDVVEPVQHSHPLCHSGARPALTTASLLRSTLNVNNGI